MSLSTIYLCLVIALGFAQPLAPAPVQTVPPRTELPQDQVLVGKALAAANCQTCHAIGQTGASPNPKSPPFRSLSRRYPVENIAEAFAEGVFVGHPEMPEFELEPHEIDGLIAYLRSVQETPKPKIKRMPKATRTKPKVP